eukprot:TRINITY_DN15745_c0_g1_i1.p1 TRINITY_DN15745_c0_g1~~TRINITY_DN15745_c0_g1_i1.p1  ORF type:complete len:418 (-),score=63.52 TRINITY_DN15745_c0_g1_i1:210-1439(-)
MSVGALGVHDMGGTPSGPVVPATHDLAPWEKEVDVLLQALRRKYPFFNSHCLRRHIEGIAPADYDRLSYYERWTVSITQIAVENGLVSRAELQSELGTAGPQSAARFSPGDRVRVRSEDLRSQWRKPHLRTPGYIFGKVGSVERVCGEFANPELAAFGEAGPPQPLYRVRFRQRHVWPQYPNPLDTIDVEVYHHWLAPAPDASDEDAEEEDHTHHHHHDDDHGHDHGDHHHDSRMEIEQRAVDKEAPEGPYQILAAALIRALVARQAISADDVRQGVEELDAMQERGHRVGASVVVKAWLDPAFKALLLKDGNAALAELNIPGAGQGAALVVVENTPSLHNLVVCTLCSCYPTRLLGRPPDWYKSRNYRARAVSHPRQVLREFGLTLAEGVEVRVHDSTADMRYLEPRG